MPPTNSDVPESSAPDDAPRLLGHVTAFDEHRGLGTVAAESGQDYMFHCIELADGSRRIEIGTAVEFEVRTKFSRPEAFDLRVRT